MDVLRFIPLPLYTFIIRICWPRKRKEEKKSAVSSCHSFQFHSFLSYYVLEIRKVNPKLGEINTGFKGFLHQCGETPRCFRHFSHRICQRETFLSGYFIFKYTTTQYTPISHHRCLCVFTVYIHYSAKNLKLTGLMLRLVSV